MDETMRKLPIGVFDSGVGGISVLCTLLKELPQERYLYFADSGNAPYGIKDQDEVKQLTMKVVNFLVQQGIKALVVACNTATSAAINQLREQYDFPVIGMEPALKPAVELKRPGKILVMATPLTLREKKFNNLLNRYRDQAEVIPLPCPGLVELIEAGQISGEVIRRYFNELLGSNRKKPAAVVLGCTHYLFVKNELAQLLGADIPIIDGNTGTALNIKRILTREGLLSPESASLNQAEQVRFFTSGNPEQIICLCKDLLTTID